MNGALCRIYHKRKERGNRSAPATAFELRPPAARKPVLYRKASAVLGHSGDRVRFFCPRRRPIRPSGRLFISDVFRGESLGLEKTTGGDLEVFFGRLRIGTIDPETMTFTVAVQN